MKNKGQALVGHVPAELSKICGRFRCDYGRETEGECIGARDSRGEGKGLKIPVDYRLTGNLKYLENFYQG